MQQRQKMKRAKKMISLRACLSIFCLFLCPSIPFHVLSFVFCFPIVFIFFRCFTHFLSASIYFHLFPIDSASFSPFCPFLPHGFSQPSHLLSFTIWYVFDQNQMMPMLLKSWTNKTKAAIADGQPRSKWTICDNPSSVCPGFFLCCSPLLASWQATSLVASQLESRQEHFWRVRQSSSSSRLLLRVYLLHKSP